MSSNILPSGQNAAAAGGWGASYQQQQQQSGGHLFANRPSTVSSAVFSQWDSPHSSQAKTTSNPARVLIGETVQNVVLGVASLGSPRAGHAQHRYSLSESRPAAPPLLQMSPRPVPAFQIGAFPTIPSGRDRSFRGDDNAGVGYDLVPPLRPSVLSAASTPRLDVESQLFTQPLQTAERDPEMAHERPQSGRDRNYLSLEDNLASKSILEDEEGQASATAQSDLPTRAGLMPPIQIAKPKIRDRTGKRTSGGKKSRKRQQSSAAADLASDGEASISSTPSTALAAGSRNRKAAASPLPISPAKRIPSASQTTAAAGKDAKPALVAGSMGVVVPMLDMHSSMSPPLVASPKARVVLFDSDDDDNNIATATLQASRKSPVERREREQGGGEEGEDRGGGEDFVDCGVEETGTAANTARLFTTARDDYLSSPSHSSAEAEVGLVAERGSEREPPAVESCHSNDQVMRSARRGDTGMEAATEATEKLSISCPTARQQLSEEALRAETTTTTAAELYEPCLSPFLSQLVDLADPQKLLDASMSLLTPSTSSKAVFETSQSVGHAPLTKTPSHRAISGTGLTAKSVDLSLSLRGGGNTSSRQQLHSRAVHLADRDGAADPLEMSCDSLEALQVLGLKPPRTALDRDTSRTSTSNAPARRGAKRVSTAEPQSFSDGPDEAKMDSSMPAVDSELLSLGEPQLLDEHSSWVTRLRAPQRTSLLVSASTDGTIRIWGSGETSSRAVLDTATFAQVMSKQTESTTTTTAPVAMPERKSAGVDSETGGSSARTVKILNAWAEDSCDTVWAACSDGALRVWSGAEGRPLRLLKGHDEPVTAMEGMDAGGAVSGGVQQSACLVSTGSADRTVRIWDVRAKKAQVFLFRGHGDTVLTLRWGDGGRSLISGGKDKTIRIWDTRAGRWVTVPMCVVRAYVYPPFPGFAPLWRNTLARWEPFACSREITLDSAQPRPAVAAPLLIFPFSARDATLCSMRGRQTATVCFHKPHTEAPPRFSARSVTEDSISVWAGRSWPLWAPITSSSCGTYAECV